MKGMLACSSTRFDGPVVRAGSRLRVLALAALIALAAPAAAQTPFTPDDLLLNVFSDSAGFSRIERFHLSGAPVSSSTVGTGTGWVGCAITLQGRLAGTRRGPQTGVDLFDSNGIQVAEFATPEVSTNGDVGVFSDGTLAIVDWSDGGVELYTEAGTWVARLLPPSSTHPFGGHIDRHDQLFLCELSPPSPNLG